MSYKYTHWLKIEDDMIEKVWINLKKYKEKYDCTMQVFYKETNFINKFIKLECNQSYQDLDLDVNSLSDNGLRHLSSKPKNIYQYNHSIEYFFKRNIKGEVSMENIINKNNIDEYRDSINSNYYDCIKLTLLNILEVTHPNLININKVTQSMLDEISEKIVEDDEFNDYVDSMLYNEIDKYIKDNNLVEEEENEYE